MAEENTVNDRLTRIETKLDRALRDIEIMTNSFATKQELTDMDKRLAKLEDTNSWIVKTVFGIIITAVSAIIFSIGKR